MSDQRSSMRDSDGASPREPLSEADLATYHIVTDTVTGVNFRRQDNVLQAICVCAATAIGAGAGVILATLNPRWNLPWFGGALFGSFLGMIVGIFASGIFLMIYRAVRHLQGKHD